MAESEETDLKLQVSLEESDDDSSFEVIEDPNNPRVSTGWTPNDAGFLVASYPVTFCLRCIHLSWLIFHCVLGSSSSWTF